MFINADGSVAKLTEREPTLEEMQKHVGGLIEYAVVTTQNKFALPTSKGKAVLTEVKDVIVNEEGLLLGMFPNPIASFAAWGHTIDNPEQLVGPCIVVCESPNKDSEIVGLEWIFENMVPEEWTSGEEYNYTQADYGEEEE